MVTVFTNPFEHTQELKGETLLTTPEKTRSKTVL